MKSSFLETYFHKISNIIIIIPLVIITVAIFLKNDDKTLSSQQKVVPSPTYAPVQSFNTEDALKQALQMLPTGTASNSAALNLTGPFTCSYKDNSTSINVYIKSQKIAIQQTENNIKNNYVLNGDCFYQWDTGATTGEKTCGVSSYIPTLDSFLQSGMMNIDSIIDQLPNNKDKSDEEKAKLKVLATSCEKKDMNSSVFTIPSTVTFKTVET